MVTADSTVGNTQEDNKTTEKEAELNLSEEEAESRAETLWKNCSWANIT